ncbi:MAG: T9SS type A sorting domain-containing protein [Rhodothermaceae bacterium]|nr:T9SS type A sorting domain-containing protein [Rhodothermaceae bacterium]
MKQHFSVWRVLFVVIILSLSIGTVRSSVSQVLTLDTMPASVVSQPDYDLHGLRRPALSIVGFDNTEPGYSPAYGLGLKQVLDLYYNQSDPLVVPVFDRLIALAHLDQTSPYEFDDIGDRRVQLDQNTAILQGRAFEALVTLVMELNGENPEDFGLRSHEAAMLALRDAFTDPAGGVLINGDDIIDDIVKFGRSIGNVARAIDVYMAIENSYFQFLGEVNPLLLMTPENRIDVLEEYGTVLIGVDMILNTAAVDVYQSEIDLPPDVIELILLLLEHRPEGDRVVAEVEPGNWALKQRAAIGYGSLVMQAEPGSLEEFLLAPLLPNTLNALDLTSAELEDDRTKNWNFMTYGGKRFWAESTYYLDWTTEQVMPFFHAVRANGLINGENPFFNPVYTNPMHWLADTVTPDARFMPLDDGNKRGVRYGGLLRWDAQYGDQALGEKFAWIDEEQGGPSLRDEVLLVELAVPRTSTTLAPPDRVGNYAEELVEHVSEQQLIVRESINQDMHYLLMNGEHGKAVDRGEGHEQPDQLQLLYFIDDISYLMDSGYDQGATVENSSWNHYYDHNVMTAGIGEGGLRPPELRILEVRKTSEPRFMGEVDALYLQEYDGVTVLHGEQVLNVMPKNIYDADYTRDVLFVSGDAPYLIDFNRVKHRLEPVRCDNNLFHMNYHVNSNTAVYYPKAQGEAGYVRWEDIGDESGRSLTAYPVSIEFDAESNQGSGPYIQLLPDEAQERQTVGKERVDIQRLNVFNPDRCEPYWSLATIFQADADPSGAPELIFPYHANSKRQGWIWPQGGNTYDVFVARSVDAPNRAIQVRPALVNPAFPDVRLSLPDDEPFGFARLMPENGNWVIDPGYQVHLTLDASSPVVAAEFRGSGKDVEEGDLFVLHDAQPNPFNPSTTIRFTLPESSRIRLAIYDVLGREVRVLREGVIEEGEHAVRIEGGNLSSGTYLVRLDAERGSLVKNIVLLK